MMIIIALNIFFDFHMPFVMLFFIFLTKKRLALKRLTISLLWFVTHEAGIIIFIMRLIITVKSPSNNKISFTQSSEIEKSVKKSLWKLLFYI